MHLDMRLPVGVLMIGIGAGIIALSGIWLYPLQMVAAEPVQAEVVSSNVSTIPCSVDESCRVRYTPAVSYRFPYDGETHRSDQVFPDAANRGDRDRDWAQAIVADYRVGEQVTAHVVPGRPSSAYLEAERPNMVLLLFSVLAVLLMVFGAAGIKQGLFDAEMPGPATASDIMDEE